VSVDEDAQLRTIYPWIGRATFDRFVLGRRAGEMMLARLEDAAAAVPSYIDRPKWIEGTSVPTTGGR
jgi:hypothetical protein